LKKLQFCIPLVTTAKQSPTTIHGLMRDLGIFGSPEGLGLEACALIAATSDV
jgi:hypothetical protein